jgi:hypothetical protein
LPRAFETEVALAMSTWSSMGSGGRAHDCSAHAPGAGRLDRRGGGAHTRGVGDVETRAERIRTAYVGGVSTRRVDDLVQTLGIEGISRAR